MSDSQQSNSPPQLPSVLTAGLSGIGLMLDGITHGCAQPELFSKPGKFRKKAPPTKSAAPHLDQPSPKMNAKIEKKDDCEVVPPFVISGLPAAGRFRFLAMFDSFKCDSARLSLRPWAWGGEVGEGTRD